MKTRINVKDQNKAKWRKRGGRKKEKKEIV